MDYQDIEKKIQEAVTVRESGDLHLSRKLFEAVLSELKEWMEVDPTKELKYIFATAAGEFVIQHRLEGPDQFEKALKLAAELLFFDKQNDLNNPLSIRAVSNTLLTMGKYKEAEPFLEALIPLYKGNSAQEGDTKAHLAFCYLNTDRLDEGAKLIDKAIALIEKNTAKNEKPFITTWMAHAYIVKSLILSAQNNIKEAKKYAEKCLELANNGNNKRRALQAQKVLAYLNSLS